MSEKPAAADIVSNAPAGFYDVDAGPKRWWDGAQWTDHYEQTRMLTSDERKAQLDADVSRLVMSGYRVESRSDYQAILVTGKPTNHVLHAILSVFTLGLWLIVWFFVAAFNKGERRMVVSV